MKIQKQKENESRKMYMIDIDKIIPNSEQTRTVDDEETQRLAKSIRKAGLINPITVTPRKNKFMLCGGEDRVNAYKLLKRKKIEAFVEDLNDDKAAERAIIENLCRKDLKSVELENAVYVRYTNGNYGTYREFGKVIGRSGERVGLVIYSRKIRMRTNGPLVSTQVIIDSKDLERDEDKIKFFKLVEKGEIAPRGVREAVRNLNKWLEGAKNAVLDGEVSYSRAKEIISRRLPLLKKLDDIIIKAGKDKKTWKKIFSEVDIEQVDVFLKLFIFAKELESNHIQEIKDETERKQVINLIINASTLFSRLLFKLDKIKKDQFEMIVNFFNMTVKDVESLKNSGHYFGFPWEWETSGEQKLSEKIRKIKSGGMVPLDEILDKTNRTLESLGRG